MADGDSLGYNVYDSLVDGFYIGVTVNGDKLTLAGVVIQNRLGLFVVDVEALSDDGFRVIRTSSQEEATHDFFLRHDEVDDKVYVASRARKELIQCLCLGESSGESI